MGKEKASKIHLARRSYMTSVGSLTNQVFLIFLCSVDCYDKEDKWEIKGLLTIIKNDSLFPEILVVNDIYWNAWMCSKF